MNTTPRLLSGRYQVGELIGRGGMAEVHRGLDTRLGRDVAIKILRSDLARDPSFLARFRREAQSAAALSHPAIVAIYDSGEDDSTEPGGTNVTTPFIIMEYVEGETLRDVLTAHGALPPAEAARITQGVLGALAYSHRAGIVHRDIKPANVMITAAGDVKVMDFGIARAIADTAATMTQTQTVIGTAQYLSPEQAQGRAVDERTDVYSTGCLFYELLTGRTPFIGDSPVSIAYQHVREEPPAPSTLRDGILPEYDAMALHAMVKDREARYQSAADFAADLAAARAGRPISAAARGSRTAAITAAADGAAAVGAGIAAGAAGTATTELLPAAQARRGVDEPTAYQDAWDDPYPRRDPAPPTTRSQRVAQSRRRNRTPIVIAIIAGLALIGGLLYFGTSGLFGPPPVKSVNVPSLQGKTADEAKQLLTAAGFVPKATEVANNTVPAGQVIDQNPAGGTTQPQGSTVQYSVSSGPGQTQVPNLVGSPQDQALATLKLANLVPQVQIVDDPSQAKGNVISTDPAAGTLVTAGSTIAVKVASGKVPVPKVVGLNQTDAVAALTNAKLAAKATYQVVADPNVPAGTVIAQSLPANQPVDVGTEVTITVAQSPAATTTVTATSTTTTTTTTTTKPPGG